MNERRNSFSGIEVCFLIGNDERILWQETGQPNAVPDSRRRWNAIWEHRLQLQEIAHTHPSGPLAFSHEDRTTMRAIWAALGRDLIFSVVTPVGMIRASRGQRAHQVLKEPEWVDVLRRTSNCKSQ